MILNRVKSGLDWLSVQQNLFDILISLNIIADSYSVMDGKYKKNTGFFGSLERFYIWAVAMQSLSAKLSNQYITHIDDTSIISWLS